MQPVTIKNNQYTNTLWLVQFLITLTLLLVIWMSLQVSFWTALLIPVLIMSALINHRTLVRQSAFAIKLNTSGQFFLQNKVNDDSSERIELQLAGSWQIPHIMLLKLTPLFGGQGIYLTVLRSKMGEQQFSNLWVGISQHKVTTELKS